MACTLPFSQSVPCGHLLWERGLRGGGGRKRRQGGGSSRPGGVVAARTEIRPVLGILFNSILLHLLYL